MGWLVWECLSGNESRIPRDTQASIFRVLQEGERTWDLGSLRALCLGCVGALVGGDTLFLGVFLALTL